MMMMSCRSVAVRLTIEPSLTLSRYMLELHLSKIMKESNKIQEKNMNVLKGKKGRDGKCFDDNNLTI